MDSLLADNAEVDPNKNYYEDLVGEGKRYKDNEALAKKAIHADLHIAKIEKENEELSQAYIRMMEESKTQATIKSLIRQYEETQTSNTTPNVKADEKPAYDPAQVESLFERKFKEKELSRKQAENFNLVRDRLTQRFGSDYQSQVKQQISDLDLSEEEFNDLARNRPQLLIKTLGLDTQSKEQFQAPPRSVTTDFRPAGKQNRYWSYYKPLLKAKPNDRALLIQMDKDAQEYGEAFFDVE